MFFFGVKYISKESRKIIAPHKHTYTYINFYVLILE